MAPNLDISALNSTCSEPLLASTLIARFLRSNNYSETLETFIREAGLPADAGAVQHTQSKIGGNSNKADTVEQWTLEGIIQEKRKFDRSLSFERYGESQRKRDEWNMRAPSLPKVVETPASSNLLSVSVAPWQIADDKEDSNEQAPYIISTTADKRLNAFKVDPGNTVAASIAGLSDSPILSNVTIRAGQYQFLATMSGQLLLVRNSQVLDRRTDHKKYVVKVLAYEDDKDGVWVATAAWDSQVLIYYTTISSCSTNGHKIGEPVGSIKLPTNPESILFVRHPESRNLMLLVSRHDSTYLYYYKLDPLSFASISQNFEEFGKQNLAPHSNAWVAFSPSCLAQSPHDPGLIAVALSTLPHMKIMIVRLLFPPLAASISDDSSASAEPHTQLTQAMSSLALQNREDAAIVIQVNTLAPQTAYSTPQVVWRPDGSGVWVNGDDGIVRGIEAKTGKVVAMLKNGHDVGSKIRSIWAGWVDVDGSQEEWVVSGGFDKKLIVWK